MWKERLQTSVFGRRLSSYWSDLINNIEGNYYISSISKIEKYSFKWRLVSRNYEQYEKRKCNVKRTVQQFALLLLEITLVIRDVLIVTKPKEIPAHILGDFLSILGKSSLVFHVLIIFFATLTCYLRALILYQENKKVLDWFWMLHPFAEHLSSLNGQNISEKGYRKLRIQAMLTYNVVKLAHRISFIGIVAFSGLFLVASSAVDLSPAKLTFSLFWWILTMIWVAYGVAMCFLAIWQQ